MDNFDYVPVNAFRKDTEAPRDWIQAAFYVGLYSFADATQDPYLTSAIVKHGEAEGWGFDQRPRHADADATGAVWVWAAARTKDQAKLAPIRARFDAVLADPSKVSLDFEPKPAKGDPYCQVRWCWSDAIFMAPPAWVSPGQGQRRQALSGPRRQRVLGDHRLSLRQDRPPLFPRQPLHQTPQRRRREDLLGAGQRLGLRGHRNILQDLPADHPSRPKYEAIFKQMAAKIVDAAGRGGLLAGLAAGAAEDAGDQRHGLLRLRPGLGREPRPAAARQVWPRDRQGLEGPGRGDRAGRPPGLGAARRRGARPGGPRRHPAVRRRRVPAGGQRGA
jgi:unsaturated rhamnogalacturonyl hydrolase